METVRSLRLRAERLAELAPGDLRRVAGGDSAPTLPVQVCLFSEQPMHTCPCCGWTHSCDR